MKAVIVQDQMVETGQQLINTKPEILAIPGPHPEQKQPCEGGQEIHQHQHIAGTAGPESPPRLISLLSSESVERAHACGGSGATAHPPREQWPLPYSDCEGDGMAR